MRLLIITVLMLPIMNIHAQQALPSNQHFWHSLPTSADAQVIWDIWTDVANWKEWDTGLQDAALNSEFELGAKGTILSLEGRSSKFEVVALELQRSYTIKTRLPLGSLYVKRYLTESDDGIVFTHEVWFSGLTKGIFAKAFGSTFREMLPEVMQNVKALAEGNE